ncbi:hypothetical protein C1S99_08230 [Vibrio parahaemolyticus]|uniref:hypothetical protein n=1 Tax=Vibrio parahaemolyticus TaxID=670 RepID=UPI000470EC74|nr:hypothetical protein [Vibrio parahaemolyticus]EHK0750574.1 hypothetical protein [Vibrio parahaemolyticus]EJE4178490.1 hypothetical protein [Vibrio parahaemolyticus]EKH9212810.1 hypothetical protein [Vibrio parahaemolyticus]ELZ7199839.1 hypothetical protein [Vibrio parahaemolyticus]MBE3834320.1 hypothetical protein [Vibrio parahaemolyticus]
MANQTETFAAKLTKLNQSMRLLGGHSRLLLMNPNRDKLIANVMADAAALLEAGQAHSGKSELAKAALKATPKEEAAKQVKESLSAGTSMGVIDGTVTDTVEADTAETKAVQCGFSVPALTLTLPEDVLNHPLTMDVVLRNPDEQRVTFKSSDESVLQFPTASELKPMIRGFGDVVVTATLHKKGDIAGSKHELSISLIREVAQNAGALADDVELAPEGSEPIGFLLPEPDYDLELTLGTDAFIDAPYELPIQVANPADAEIEFESSDDSVFEVDAKTGALLPKGEGDAMLMVHVGDVKDELFVSIKA